MEKLLKYLMLMLVATFSIVVFSCSDDKGDDPDNPSKSQVANATKNQIKETFPGLRLDSIHSHESYGNIKLEYEDGLLVAYKECYPSGNVHDGVDFKLTYTPDTIYVNSYKAVIGENGLVEKLICPNGKVNQYNYDDQGHLVRYDVDVVNIQDKQYYEVTWENDNVISHRNNYQDGGSWRVEEVFYDYYDELNLAGILPPLRSYNWIEDTGLSVGYGINDVLYYAGLLGRGTKNLVKSCGHRYSSFTYNLDGVGYVVAVSGSKTYGSYVEDPVTDEYFYQ